ncbi:MAG: radical SAM protein, partial [Syntrophaceae bacterium]
MYRSVEDIKADIDTVNAISDELTAVSGKMGQGGRITGELGMAILRADPSLNDNYCFVTVFNWLHSGGKTAFLQDADSMIMRPHEFMEVLKHLR